MQPKDRYPLSPRRLGVLPHGAQTDAETLFDLDRRRDRLWLGTRDESYCLDQRQIEIFHRGQLPVAICDGSRSSRGDIGYN